MDNLSRLIETLRYLPGIGPRSAQRIAFHLLQHRRQHGLELAFNLEQAMKNIRHCQRCNNYTEVLLCALCQNSQRNLKTLCVVEQPQDLLVIEESQAFSGSYYVLMGKISPLDGIGPEELGLFKLRDRIIQEEVEEVILALSPTMEGQATHYFIVDLLASYPLVISQLAQGVPFESELEYLDSQTLRSALHNRSKIKLEGHSVKSDDEEKYAYSPLQEEFF